MPSFPQGWAFFYQKITLTLSLFVSKTAFKSKNNSQSRVITPALFLNS